MRAKRLTGSFRRRRARSTPGREQRLARFLAEVEPALAAVPRVHRFAAVPRIGPLPGRPRPLPVLLEGEDLDARSSTRAALDAQTIPPAAVLEARDGEDPGLDGVAWLVALGAGELPAPRALERLAQAIKLAPDASLITCDEDHIDPAGRRGAPVLRPGPSPDLLLARDLTSSLVAVRADRLPTGFQPGWRYRAALELGGAGGEGLAHVPALLSHLVGSRPAAGGRVELDDVRAALDRRRGGARLEVSADGRRRVRRAVVGEPRVAVVVLFRDKPELLARCARSVLGSSYERLELRLVDNGSEDPAVAPLLARLARDRRVTVLRDPGPFNFAVLNNAAVRGAEADVLVFLNNDTEVITSAWVEELLEEAQRPEVGAVAPLLLYPDGGVQHAGAALGLFGYAGHPFAGLRPDELTPFGRASDGTRNWLAVTAACLMVEKAKFDGVGGFDEDFVVAGNDVDLCLRLTARGHRSLCVPWVELLHDESRSRGTYIDPGDFERSARSYGDFRTVGDPFYNPNLTLSASTCELRQPGETLP